MSHLIHTRALSAILGLLVAIGLQSCSRLSPASPTTQSQPPPALAAEACQPTVTPDHPPTGLPWTRPSALIAGGAVQNGDFLFDLWLYCDNTLGPNDPQHYSEIAGLGIYTAWSYTGPKVEGYNADFWGMVPDVRMGTSWTGPLYKAQSYGSSGISTQDGAFLLTARQGLPVSFQRSLLSPMGAFGATITFKLVAATDGYVPAGVTVEAWNPSS
jgi:hypothetical protein